MAKDVIEKVVPDTSTLVDCFLCASIEKNETQVKEVIIHEASIAELEHQANQGKASGFIGLDEVKRLQSLAEKGTITLRFSGTRPHPLELQRADSSTIDAAIRQLAFDEDATLFTDDEIQAKVAEARGIKVHTVEKAIPKEPKRVQLESFFDETTMSVHLRENAVPMAKKGKPGAWSFDAIRPEVMGHDEMKNISSEIIAEAGTRRDSFLELERSGSTIVQLGTYRIVILKQPLSDGWEITAVHPVKRLTLDDYDMSSKLRERISEHAEGILIAGAPGNGKTTFAQALAEHYASLGKIVKTVEAPRDLILPETITQLAISKGTPEEIHDILLLSRPDYTIFDEMRNTPDFALFADLRLAGVGMVGVIHGTKALDSIQRFIGRIELGVIPHVIDTLVYIENGQTAQVLAIKMVVKVPAGMTEADLARPVVVISEFESNKPVAEIYTYGEQTVVVPVSDEMNAPTGAKKLAAESIKREMQKYADDVKVEVMSDQKAVVYVPEKFISGIIGREGKNISKIEKKIGIGLDIRELQGSLDEKPKQLGTEIPYDMEHSGKSLQFFVNAKGKDVHLYVNDEYMATFAIGKKGVIKIKKSNQLGKTLIDALSSGDKISFVI